MTQIKQSRNIGEYKGAVHPPAGTVAFEVGFDGFGSYHVLSVWKCVSVCIPAGTEWNGSVKEMQHMFLTFFPALPPGSFYLRVGATEWTPVVGDEPVMA